MHQRVKLLVILLAVPVIAFVVAQTLVLRFDQSLQQTLARNYPQVPQEQRAAVTPKRICADGEARLGLEEACAWYTRFRWMRLTAFWAGAGALGWVAVIAFAGRLARRDRTLLLRVFGPGLRVTNVLVVCLIALHGVLAVSALYLAESMLLGVYHPKILLLVAAGAVVGVIAMARASFSIIKPATISVAGRPLARDEAPELWRLVDDVAGRAQASTPDGLIVGLDLNFFVTEAEVRCLDVGLTGRVLFVSLPLSRILTRDELSSIIGHELGHFKGQDTEFSRRFYPVYRGTANALEVLAATGAGILGSIALIPASAVLVFFLESFAVAANTIGRERELAADAVGAAVAGAATTATALVKVHAFTKHWEPVHHAMVEAVRQHGPLDNLSERFAATVASKATIDAFVGLDQERLRHPMDSHPPLGARLERLGVPLASVRDAALDVTPSTAAIHVVPSHERIESELSAVTQQYVARALGVSPTVGAV